jgi:hypothetical protein
VSALIAALVFGALIRQIVTYGVAPPFTPRYGPGMAAGILGGLAAGVVVGGLKSVPSDLAAAASPGAVLARDRRAALTLGAADGFMTALLIGLIVSGGIGIGLAIGLGLSMRQTAWPSYRLTGMSLAMQRHLPWSLMRFLADAHQRGILRQAGAVYQFRHIELQHRLATRPPQPPRP